MSEHTPTTDQIRAVFMGGAANEDLLIRWHVPAILAAIASATLGFWIAGTYE